MTSKGIRLRGIEGMEKIRVGNFNWRYGIYYELIIIIRIREIRKLIFNLTYIT